MNTSATKTFAPAVRRQLMEAVTRKLDFALTAQTPDYLTTFAPQVTSLRKLAQADRAGLIERVAYTWFNRLAALRFMDARGWHPFRARVLTPASAEETQPELLKLTRTGALPEELKSHTDPTRLNDLLDGRIPSPDAQGEVYRHLVLAACRFYHALLPNLFEKLDDETELLLPDDLLTEHSVVHGFRTEISDEDCGDGQRANVEILGWLYQFYISERKEQVMARKSAVPTEDIPAVTQLFTPHWIVRYLVENSLGRLWMENRPSSRLREHMPYYIGESSAGILPAPLSAEAEAGGTPALHSFQPFDPRATVETTRRHLPHWQQEGTTYFITFRLGDSIPQEKLALWESERQQWLTVHPEPWDEQSIAEYRKRFSERREQWLDNGYGRCLLGIPAIAEIVRSALVHFDGQRYLLDEFVLMPNHVHLLVKPLPGYDLSSILHSWKSFTAKAMNKAIGATGTVWQDESHDHIVRSSVQWEFYRNYIRENPGKAGLERIQSQSGAGILPQSSAGILPAPLSAGAEAGGTPALRITKPEEIRLCDPAVGSGHMLTYAFDLLTLIYEEEGYAPTEIPGLILRHNLHGLEICPRAAQLASWPSSSRPGKSPAASSSPNTSSGPASSSCATCASRKTSCATTSTPSGWATSSISPCSGCSTSSRRRRTSAPSSSRASTNGPSPTPATPSRQWTSAASSSCARRTSKSCARSNKPRRSPSGITSSWPIRRIWERKIRQPS